MLELIKTAEEGKKIADERDIVRKKIEEIAKEKRIYDEILWNRMFEDLLSLKPYMLNIRLLKTNIRYRDSEFYGFNMSDKDGINLYSYRNMETKTFFFGMVREKPYEGKGLFADKIDVLRNKILPIWKDVFEDIKNNSIRDIEIHNRKANSEIAKFNKSLKALEDVKLVAKDLKLSKDDVAKLMLIYPELKDTGIEMIETAQRDGYYEGEIINEDFILNYITSEINEGMILIPNHEAME